LNEFSAVVENITTPSYCVEDRNEVIIEDNDVCLVLDDGTTALAHSKANVGSLDGLDISN